MNQLKLIIIGGGPAGMTASIYASRYKIPHLISASFVGGLAKEAHSVENWPGLKQVKGSDLMNQFWEHAKSYNPDFQPNEVKKIEKTEKGFRVFFNNELSFEIPSLVFAGGTQHRRLSIAGEKELLGRGVSYCATCDAGFFKEKEVAVIGGANSAIMATIELSQHVSKIYLIFRGPELKGEAIWIERVKENPKVVLVPETNITKIIGSAKVEKIELDKPFQDNNLIDVEGVFIEIGATPLVDLRKDLNVDLDESGSIKIDGKGMTNIPGLFAAGDATNGSGGFRQIITASAEGAIASRGVFEYLKTKGEI